MHLCYVYIKEYKCLKDIELVIDCHYNYKYDQENKTLEISKNKEFPDNFWGENIYSITGLVGNNGAGKTVAMECLVTILEGLNKSINCIVVYKEDTFMIYERIDISIIIPDKTYYVKITDNNFPCFYYSGHFSPYYRGNAVNWALPGSESYIASDGVMLIKDISSYYKESSLTYKDYIHHLYAHVAQNNYRICMMLANVGIAKIIKKFIWPRYITFRINYSGEKSVRNIIMEENIKRKEHGKTKANITIPSFNQLLDTNQYKSKNDIFWSLLIFHNILNYLNEKWEYIEDLNIINDWGKNIPKYLKSDNNIVEWFKYYVNNIKNKHIKDGLNKINNIIEVLYKYTNYIYDDRDGFLYIDCKEEIKSLSIIGEEILSNEDFYITSKFFNIYYSQSLDSNTILSSGEMELLNLFSRIYDAIHTKPNKLKKTGPLYLIMLDEAEIGFHPEWQRKYLNLLIEFLNALKTTDPQIPDYQIIISTHSPILLSDIPKNCTNYLKKDFNNTTTNVPKNDIGETFAANVFDLYRMSFFMEDGLIGEFACKKINELNSRIDGGEIEGIINEIKMIGDERIQEYLIDKYQKKHPEDESLNKDIIRYYEEKIKKLKDIRKN